MKRIVCFIISALLLLTMTAMPVSAAASYKNVLLLGDSITYGYGLEGTRDTCASYGNQLRDYLGLDAGSFQNAAVNGDTSSDLLALLPSLDSRVKAADLIVISVGGNDLLHIMWDAAAAVLNLTSVSAAELKKVMEDSDKVQKFIEQLTPAKISQTISKYSVNLSAIISLIRSSNPDAEVIFLAQYDPFTGVPGLEALTKVAAGAIPMLNMMMQNAVAVGKCTYLDLYTPFTGHAVEWTNILEFDIHPNTTGHKQIFEILKAYLETKAPAVTEEVTTEAVTTEAVTTEAVTTEAVTTAAITEAPTEAPELTTAAPVIATPDETTAADPSSGGCGGALAGGTVLCVLALAGFAVMKKKKY